MCAKTITELQTEYLSLKSQLKTLSQKSIAAKAAWMEQVYKSKQEIAQSLENKYFKRAEYNLNDEDFELEFISNVNLVEETYSIVSIECIEGECNIYHVCDCSFNPRINDVEKYIEISKNEFDICFSKAINKILNVIGSTRSVLLEKHK